MTTAMPQILHENGAMMLDENGRYFGESHEEFQKWRARYANNPKYYKSNYVQRNIALGHVIHDADVLPELRHGCL